MLFITLNKSVPDNILHPAPLPGRHTTLAGEQGTAADAEQARLIREKTNQVDLVVAEDRPVPIGRHHLSKELGHVPCWKL